MANLREQYVEQIRPAICKEKGYKNALQAPRLEKIVVNIGVDAQVDKDTFQLLNDELAAITGQKPRVNRATKSVSNFRLREGMPIGAKVTLRGRRMYDFLERLVNTALPRVRDFRGIPGSGFDGRGNYNFGVTEQTIFPEINPDRVKKTQGMDINIVTTAETDEEGKALLQAFGLPFAN